MKAVCLLLAASLVLLSSAVRLTHTRAHARTETSATVHHLAPNSTFSLIEAQAPAIVGVLSVNITGDAFGCPTGYSYLAFTDAQNNPQSFCNYLPYWAMLRTQGGGSTDGPGYQCKSRSSDARILIQSACVKTTFAKIIVSNTLTCPTGYSTPTINEAIANKDTFCKLVETWDIVRIGVLGSMDGPGYGCGTRDWDERGMHVLCVQRNVTNIVATDTQRQENACPNGQSLLTVEEVMANRQSYCNLLGTWTTARLAGGGSFYGSGYGCKVKNEDLQSLPNALCGPNTR